MKFKSLLKVTLIITLIISLLNYSSATNPVNPDATPEAKALLDLFYRISGNYTLTGQHNYPNTKDRISSVEILLDGTPVKSEVYNAPCISTAHWDKETQSILISSDVTFTWGGRSVEMKSSEVWKLLEDGNLLQIERTSTGFRGVENRVLLVYVKQ